MSWSSSAAGALVVGSILATANLAAQGITAQFGVAGGRTFPTGDFHAAASGEGFNSGWQGVALVALEVAGWPVGFRVDGTYGTHGANDQLNDELTARLGPPSDERTTLLGANVDLTYPFRSAARLQPYLLGGMGAYHVTISVTSGGATVDKSETRFAWNVGGGMLYRVRGVALFLEARYIDVAAVSGFPGMTFLPISAGVRVGGP